MVAMPEHEQGANCGSLRAHRSRFGMSVWYECAPASYEATEPRHDALALVCLPPDHGFALSVARWRWCEGRLREPSVADEAAERVW